MHELTIAQALIDQISGWRRDHGGTARIVRAAVEIGRLSGVDPEALRYAWKTACECAGKDSFLSACRLDERLLPLKFRCSGCGRVFECEQWLSECPACGGKEFSRSGGRELILKEIEVE